MFGHSMFGSVRSSVLLLCDQTSLGIYSLMFTNCSDFCDVRNVRCSDIQCSVCSKFSILVFISRLEIISLLTVDDRAKPILVNSAQYCMLIDAITAICTFLEFRALWHIQPIFWNRRLASICYKSLKRFMLELQFASQKYSALD